MRQLVAALADACRSGKPDAEIVDTPPVVPAGGGADSRNALGAGTVRPGNVVIRYSGVSARSR
jgi:hypothetical protein